MWLPDFHYPAPSFALAPCQTGETFSCHADPGQAPRDSHFSAVYARLHTLELSASKNCILGDG